MTLHEQKMEIMKKYAEDMTTLSRPFSMGDRIIDKWVSKIKKNFGVNFERNSLLGFYDTSLLENAKSGWIFTDDKLYEKEGKLRKIWYDEIESLTIDDRGGKIDCEKHLIVTNKDGSTVTIISSCIKKTPLKEFLSEIMNLCGNCSHTLNSSTPQKIGQNSLSGSEVGGLSVGNYGNVNKLFDEEKFHAKQGHGFAAERANTLVDKLTGHDAKIIGDDNSFNGADRIVDGIEIQSKYCASGSRCINECFDDRGNFRYYSKDGSPMQIEVPSDKYEAAVSAMEEKIKSGQVEGVTDPEEAKNIVRKGHFTYAQAKNIAKAGTVESITYDAVNGTIIAASAFGITTVLTFATSIWNGEDFDVALKNATYSGLKVGGTTFVITLIASQLSKAGLNSALVSSSEAIVNIMGPKASAFLVNAFRHGSNIYGAAAMKSAAKLLRGNIITSGVSIVVLSSMDIANIFRGRISGKQLFKNFTNTAASVAAGTGGWVGGAAAGAAIGSAVPIIGTAVGGVVGGLVGSVVSGIAASKATNAVLDLFIEDDAENMVKIIEKEFQKLAEDYLLNRIEAEKITDILAGKLDGKVLKDMFASDNRSKFAVNVLEPIIESEISKREKIKLPDDTQIIDCLVSIIEDMTDEDDYH